VHSHLWAAVLFLFFLATVYTKVSQYDTTTWLDGSYIAIFLTAATICLTASALFHLSLCHSKEVNSWTGCMDYFGIIGLKTIQVAILSN
jgi:adiponectin receptor